MLTYKTDNIFYDIFTPVSQTSEIYYCWKWCNINFINFRIVGRPGKYTTLFGARQEEVLAFVLEYL